MTFEDAFARLLGHEGGYVNHPEDPGGATRWGVTEKVARANGYQGDMREFPQTQAMAIYRRQYWDSVKADLLPANLRFDVFDAAVNSGVLQATRWLQRTIGVTEDGVIGPKTLAAAQAADPSAAARFNGHRLEFLASLSTWPDFGRGWARRIASNLKG